MIMIYVIYQKIYMQKCFKFISIFDNAVINGKSADDFLLLWNKLEDCHKFD